MNFKYAKNYDKFAVAQSYAAKSLISLLEIFGFNFDNIYEIGCGSGLLTNLIIQRLKFKNLSLNDLYKSDIMDEFNAQIGDICDIDMPKNLDLVLSSSVFQWIYPLKTLSQKIYDSLNDDGICAFSMLCLGSLYELSSFTKQSLDYKSAEEIKRIFSKNFEILAFRTSIFVQEFLSLKELLISLKETGVNNLQGNFVLNKTTLQGLNKHFNNEFKLSFNYVFVVAKKVKND